MDLVDVDVFRMQIQRMGAARPRIALFVSQDDEALSLSGKIWGGVGRLGDVDPTQEPYRSEFERDKILVFNLSGLASPGDNAHDRAFEDVTSVMGMIKRRHLAGSGRSSELLVQRLVQRPGQAALHGHQEGQGS